MKRSGREATSRTASSTPGMKERRSIESWRMLSVCPSPPKIDLLVGDEAGEPHRVNRLVDVAAGLADQLRGALRGSRRRVELLVVVELDDLALGHVRGDPLRGLHQQHGADREVGSDEAVGRAGAGRLGRLAQGVEVEAGRAEHDMDPGLQAGAGVVERRLGRGEVDDDVGLAERVGELDPEGGIGPARRAPCPRRPRPPRRRPGPCAPPRPRRRPGSRARPALSLTGASASRKHSSPRPTQAAESRSAP